MQMNVNKCHCGTLCFNAFSISLNASMCMLYASFHFYLFFIYIYIFINTCTIEWSVYIKLYKPLKAGQYIF